MRVKTHTDALREKWIRHVVVVTKFWLDDNKSKTSIKVHSHCFELLVLVTAAVVVAWASYCCYHGNVTSHFSFLFHTFLAQWPVLTITSDVQVNFSFSKLWISILIRWLTLPCLSRQQRKPLPAKKQMIYLPCWLICLTVISCFVNHCSF